MAPADKKDGRSHSGSGADKARPDKAKHDVSKAGNEKSGPSGSGTSAEGVSRAGKSTVSNVTSGTGLVVTSPKVAGSGAGVSKLLGAMGMDRVGGRLVDTSDAGSNGLAQLMANPPAPGLINAGGYDQVMVAQQHYILDSIKRLEEANKAVYNMVNEAKKEKEVLPPVSVPQILAPKGTGREEEIVSESNETDDEENEAQDAMETEEEVISLAEKFAGGSNKRIVPEEMELFLWEQARKCGSDFGPLDWKSLKVGQLIKIYNSHVSAEVFCAQEADPEAPDLTFKDKREMEKTLKSCQNATGAAASAVTHLLTKVQDECDNLLQTAKDYRDPNVSIEDPRNEAAMIMDVIRDRLMNDWAKIMSDQVKILAWEFNSLLMTRRGQYLFRITEHKNARSIVKRLNPSTRFLFGNKMGDVSRNLKDSEQLNPLASTTKFRTSYKGSGGSNQWFSKGRGSYSSRGKSSFGSGYSGSGYSGSNERLLRFGGKTRGFRGGKK